MTGGGPMSAGGSGSDDLAPGRPREGQDDRARDAAGGGPARALGEGAGITAEDDDRQYAEPVDPWATEEAQAPVAFYPGSPAHPFAPGGSGAGGRVPDGLPQHGMSPGHPHGRLPWNGAAAGHPAGAAAAGTGHGAGGGGGRAAAAGEGHGHPSGAKTRRRRAYVVGGAAVMVVVLAAGSVLAWTYWPGYRSLDYHPLSEPKRIPPLVAVGSAWSDAAIIGERAYFASSEEETGAVGVVAVDTGTAKARWRSPAAGTAPAWESMVALPDGLALFTKTASENGTDTPVDKRRMAVLGAADGKLRWQRTLDPDDRVYFAGGSAVVSDRAGKRLLGLKLSDGTERWSLPDPDGSSSTYPPKVLPVTTPKDLEGPATVSGRPYDPDLGDDPRLVEIGADRSVRVVDADSGEVLRTRRNVADTTQEMVAHDGRLVVHQPDDQQIVSYDLDDLGEPQVLYTAQQQNPQIGVVVACGTDRICFSETAGYDSKTATVVALDAADKRQLWRFPVANVQNMVPVGTAVLATTSTETTLLGGDGKKIWSSTGEAVRLDGGNLLEFSKPLSRSPSDPALAGRHIGDPAVPLGAFRDIRSDTCAWTTSTLACVADEDFVLMTFAG